MLNARNYLYLTAFSESVFRGLNAFLRENRAGIYCRAPALTTMIFTMSAATTPLGG
jgi:hypothetical protein